MIVPNMTSLLLLLLLLLLLCVDLCDAQHLTEKIDDVRDMHRGR